MLSRYRSLCLVAVALMLWVLSACGDGNAESTVNTIDADIEVTEDPPDGSPLVGDGDRDSNGIDIDASGSDAGFEIPAGTEAEPPSAEFSPSERQSRQELAIVEREVLPEPTQPPEPEAEPAETADAAIPPRADIGSFPDTIPVTVEGNDGTTSAQPNSPVGARPNDAVFNASLFGSQAEIEPPVLSADEENGVEAPLEPVIEAADDDAPTPEGPDDADICLGFDDCSELDTGRIDGAGDLIIGGDSGGQATSPDGPREPDCDSRPWDRGCPGPAPDYVGSGEVDAPIADTAPTSGGVDVPQEVQDALLAPVD